MWVVLSLSVITSAGATDRWIKVADGKWDLSPKTLSDIKANIEGYVRSQAKTQKRELKNWQDYTFQYRGQEEKGKKYLFINALCTQSGHQDLDKKIIYILDGGSCYFNLKYDPVKKEFFDISINDET